MEGRADAGGSTRSLRVGSDRGLLSRAWAVVYEHPLAAIFLLGMVVRVVTALVLSRYFSGSLVLDDGTYWNMARDVATHNTSTWITYYQDLYHSTLSFTWPLSVLYRLFGPSQISGQLFVAVLGSGTAVAVYLLAKEALPKRWAFASALIIALLPSQILWSSLILKDAAVWFVMVTLALFIARGAGARGRSLFVLALAVAADLVVLAYLREHTLVVACWSLALVSWVGVKELRLQRVAGAVVLAVTIPWLTGLGPAGISFVTHAGSIDDRREANAGDASTAIVPGGENTAASRLEQSKKKAAELAATRKKLADKIASLQEKVDTGGSGGVGSGKKGGVAGKHQREELLQLKKQAEDLSAQLAATTATQTQAAQQLASIEGARREPGIKHMARGMSVMLMEPYPWDPGTSPSFKMAQAETIVWYPVLLLALIGLWGAVRALRVTAFPLLFGGGIMLVYALVEGNVGTAYRHRGEFIWVIALLAGFGIAAIARKIAARRGDRDVVADPQAVTS
jgi:hypothetical protein